MKPLLGTEYSNIAELLKGVRGAGLQFQSGLGPVMAALAQERRVLEPMLEMQRALAAAVRPSAFQQMAESLRVPKIDFPGQELARALESARRFHIPLDSITTFPSNWIRDAILHLPEPTRDGVVRLAKQGWFLDLGMAVKDMIELEELLEQGKVDEAESQLTAHFRASLSRIESDLNRLYPKRARFVSAARRAHEAGDFALSIPLLLAQADGTCRDAIGVQLFKRKQSKGAKEMKVEPATADYAKSVGVDSFNAALLAPLAETLPISAVPDERGEGFNQLNRHQVMHGESVEYDTEINGLRAWSLLNYVGTVLAPEDEKVKAKE